MEKVKGKDKILGCSYNWVFRIDPSRSPQFAVPELPARRQNLPESRPSTSASMGQDSMEEADETASDEPKTHTEDEMYRLKLQ